MNTPRLSIVLPAFNEEAALPGTIDRIEKVVSEHFAGPDEVEVIVVSDGSTDRTFDVAVECLDRELNGHVVEFVHNVGSHAAIRRGLEQATGDIVAVISADGQDPPEKLPEMVDLIAPGIEIVWGRRANRRGDSWLTRTLAAAYYRLFRLLTRLDYPESGLDFLVLGRPVVDAVSMYGERNLPLFLTIYNLGYGQGYVDYDRAERVAGTSGWTTAMKLKAGGDMLIAISAAPLRLLSIVGVTAGIVGLGFGFVTTIRALAGQTPDSGWASLMTAVSVLGGLILIGLSVLGEYVWRTLDETRRRPLYLISRQSERR